MFGQTQHIALLRKLLTSCTLAQNRQTIFASATIPQHNQFIQKCISEKWVKVSKFIAGSGVHSAIIINMKVEPYDQTWNDSSLLYNIGWITFYSRQRPIYY